MCPMPRLAAIAAILVVSCGPAWAQMDDIWRAGVRVNVVASEHRDVWVAGALVSIRGVVNHELTAAGAEVDADVNTKGDTRLAGAIVSVTGEFDKDLYVGGARVNVDARIAGSLKAAGARVLVGSRTEIEGPARLAGADVVFAGDAHGPAEMYGDLVRIDGHIAGNVLVRARSVVIGKTAVVDGDAIFQTLDEPQIEQGAILRGRQTVTLPQPTAPDPRATLKALLAVLLFGIGAGLILGLILLLGARSLVEQAIACVRQSPFQALVIGLAILILVPVIATFLIVIIVGIPVGLLTLLAFPLMLFVGWVIATFAISDWLFNRGRAERSFGMRLLFLLGGLVVVSLIGIVPIVGALVWLLVMFIGLGALWQALRVKPSPRPA